MGGSGTRVVAKLLLEFGYHLGKDLSPSLDNLWFMLLFGYGRAEWRRRSPEEVPLALRVFEKAMLGEGSLEPAESALLRDAIEDWSANPDIGQTGERAQRRRSLLSALGQSMRNSAGVPTGAAGWGWKDPDTHIHLEQVTAAFPETRYIHVIRNGLALTGKQKTMRQVRSWGWLFGVESPDGNAQPGPREALRYWIRANQRALELGPVLLGDRFLCLRHESTCDNPAGAVAAIAEFLGLDPEPQTTQRFSAFLERRSENGPWRTDRFDAGDLAAVESLGFPLKQRDA